MLFHNSVIRELQKLINLIEIIFDVRSKLYVMCYAYMWAIISNTMFPHKKVYFV